MIDKKVFAYSLQKLALVIPAFAPDFSKKEVLQAWFESLCDLDPEKFDSALRQAALGCETFPAVARIRALAGQESPSKEVQATHVANAIAEALRIGPERPMEAYKRMGPVAAAVAVKLGNWRDLCMGTDVNQLEWIKRSWIKIAKEHLSDHNAPVLMLAQSDTLALPESESDDEKFVHVSSHSIEERVAIKTKLREATI